jgi:transcriptional regulator with XRE-family HTH domain
MIRESIQQALKSQGVSQRRCALDCGIAPQNLNQFLKGRRQMPFDKLERILKYLKIEMK